MWDLTHINNNYYQIFHFRLRNANSGFCYWSGITVFHWQGNCFSNGLMKINGPPQISLFCQWYTTKSCRASQEKWGSQLDCVYCASKASVINNVMLPFLGFKKCIWKMKWSKDGILNEKITNADKC